MGRNIEKYINRANENYSPCSNGWVYKNENAFKSKSNEICYIGENDLMDLFDADVDLADKELIENGYAETYNTIIEKVRESGLADSDDNIQEIAELIFDNADWACICTYINEL